MRQRVHEGHYEVITGRMTTAVWKSIVVLVLREYQFL